MYVRWSANTITNGFIIYIQELGKFSNETLLHNLYNNSNIIEFRITRFQQNFQTYYVYRTIEFWRIIQT